jgi:hypothetical protein
MGTARAGIRQCRQQGEHAGRLLQVAQAGSIR